MFHPPPPHDQVICDTSATLSTRWRWSTWRWSAPHRSPSTRNAQSSPSHSHPQSLTAQWQHSSGWRWE